MTDTEFDDLFQAYMGGTLAAEQGNDLLATIRQGFGKFNDAGEHCRAPILGRGHAGDQLPGRIQAPIGPAIEARELLGVEHPA